VDSNPDQEGENQNMRIWLQLGDACAKLVQALVEAIRHKLSRLVLGFSDQLTDL
jgi:hypothetical protein